MFRRITRLTRVVILIMCFGNGAFFVVCGGLVFLSLFSCSVFIRICVQSGSVGMEYGGGDRYGIQ